MLGCVLSSALTTATVLMKKSVATMAVDISASHHTQVTSETSKTAESTVQFSERVPVFHDCMFCVWFTSEARSVCCTSGDPHVCRVLLS